MACRHPRESRIFHTADTHPEGKGYVCTKCGRFVPHERSLRGKRANKAGRRQSWEVAKEIGGTNHESQGEKYDVLNDMFAVQSKKGTMFPERLHKWLTEIPTVDDRIPVLVIKDSPGPGTRRRALAVMDWSDWKDLHLNEEG